MLCSNSFVGQTTFELINLIWASTKGDRYEQNYIRPTYFALDYINKKCNRDSLISFQGTTDGQTDWQGLFCVFN